MEIRPIKSEEDYQKTLRRIEILFDVPDGSPEEDELDILCTLVEKYEEKYFPIDKPDPIEAIKFRMEQMGYSQQDLANILGQKSHVSEILNRKRKLSLDMIRRIHQKLNIPTEVLIQPY